MPEKMALATIKELIQVLQDRAILYHHALVDLAHSHLMDLKNIFGHIIRESHSFQQDLKNDLARLDGNSDEEDKPHKGAIYRVWENLKAPIEGETSKVILEICEQESEALGRAYEAALSSADALDNFLKRRLNRHILMIRDSETAIRAYHDAL